MDERQLIAFNSPCSKAQETVAEKFWRRMCVDGRWLSTIVTLNK